MTEDSTIKFFCRFWPKPEHEKGHDQRVLVIPATNSCVVGVSEQQLKC